MHAKQRVGVVLATTTLFSATWAVSPAFAQATKKPAAPAAKPAAAKPAAAKPATAKTAEPTDVAAVVGGVTITCDDVYNQLLDMPSQQFSQTLGDLAMKGLLANKGTSATVTRAQIMQALFAEKSSVAASALDGMIKKTAILQATKKAGLMPTDAEIAADVKKAVDQARKGQHLDNMSDAQILARFHVKEASLRDNVTAGMCLDRLTRAQVAKKFGHPIGDSDYVQARNLLVRVDRAPDAKPEDITKAENEAKAKIDGYLADIKAGKRKFEDIASEVNTDSTKATGGDLGVFTRGVMVDEFDKVVFTLPKGQVSDPVKTTYGWHLIRVDRVGADISADEKAQALEPLLNRYRQETIDRIVTEAKVKNNYPMEQPQGPMMLPQEGR